MSNRNRKARQSEKHQVVDRAAPSTSLPTIAPADGTVEALKWSALVLMTGDHVNKYLLNDSVPVMFDLGRLVMPVFAFVLAYNLSRPGVIAGGAGGRVLRRLVVFGAIASVPFIALGGLGWGWWPINVLGMLAVLVGIIQLAAKPSLGRLAAAVGLFLVGGAFVEFWWPGLVVGLAAWSYCKRPTWGALIAWVVGLAALRVVNGNWWALAALPIIFGAVRVQVRVPRVRWAFYAYYPLHLGAIWLLRAAMSMPVH